jgi:hypothetical protein
MVSRVQRTWPPVIWNSLRHVACLFQKRPDSDDYDASPGGRFDQASSNYDTQPQNSYNILVNFELERRDRQWLASAVAPATTLFQKIHREAEMNY